MYANSSSIESAQTGIHDKLIELVLKHRDAEYRKPIASWNADAYRQAMSRWDGHSPIVLDAGCGVGWSTLQLGREYPDHFVIGVDQSEDRLGRGKPLTQPDNVQFVRADLVDFWRLLANDSIRLARHYLLYPNPWPKIGHLSRRWHGHPVFPVVPSLGGVLECRSNWWIYAQELAAALTLLKGGVVQPEPWEVAQALTPFERKYRDSGQSLYRLVLDLDA